MTLKDITKAVTITIKLGDGIDSASLDHWDMTGKLTYVATEKHRVAGQEVTLNHYRITGSLNVDLWYDGNERLVRQEWMEQGHKTIMVLVRVRR